MNRDAFRCFARNGRWGTCGGCPRDLEGHAYPEFCADTARYDHWLDVDDLALNHKNILKAQELDSKRRDA